MKTIARFALPAALAFAAFGVQAQTIETDYPHVTGNVGIATVAPVEQSNAQQASSQAAPFLVQSNFEGPKANPAYARASTLNRAQVRASAQITEVQGPGHNA